MRKRISAAAITVAMSSSVLVAPSAFATEEGSADLKTSTKASSAVSTLNLSYGNNNDLEVPWGSTREFEIEGSLPKNATFIAPTDKVEGWEYAVDRKTGKLTVSASEPRRIGSTLTMPITVLTPRGYSYINVKVTVVKGETSQSEQVSVEYPSEFIEIAPGESATVEPTVTGDLPSGTRFIMNEKNADNWTFTIDNEGVITATLPEDAKPGYTWTMGVIIVFPDGTQQDLKVPFKAA